MHKAIIIASLQGEYMYQNRVLAILLAHIVLCGTVYSYKIGNATLANIKRAPYENQDRLYINHSTNGELFVSVFDSHLSAIPAEHCTLHMHEIFQQKNLTEEDISRCLYESFIMCDKQIEEMEAQSPVYIGGTTALACYFKDKTLYVANTGDSHGILHSEGLPPISLSRMHTPKEGTPEYTRVIQAGARIRVGYKIDFDDQSVIHYCLRRFNGKNPKSFTEEWLIDAPEEAQETIVSALKSLHNDGRAFQEKFPRGKVILQWSVAHPEENFCTLSMSRALGDVAMKPYGVIPNPNLSERRLIHEDSFILLATDGLWDVFTQEEVVAKIKTLRREYPERDLDFICNSLCQAARNLDSGDDITVVMVCFDPEDVH